MKKITLLTSHLKKGGAQRVVSNLSKQLSEKFNVYIFLFDGEDQVYPNEGTIIDLKTPPSNNIFLKITKNYN